MHVLRYRKYRETTTRTEIFLIKQRPNQH